MATWRELGYVPNSDEEDISDGELSTQGEASVGQQELENEPGMENGSAENEPGGEVEVETKEMEETIAIRHVATQEAVVSQNIEEDTIMIDPVDEVDADMNQTPKQSQINYGLGISADSSSNQPRDSEQQLDETAVEKGADASALGFDNQLGESEEKLQSDETLRSYREISVLDLSNIYDEEEVVDLRDIQGTREARIENGQDQFRPSPDPITGEVQDSLYNQYEGRTIPFGGVQGPSTPSRQNFRQPSKIIDSSSMISSSPLSSPPSMESTPPLPSSVPQHMAALTAAFQIVIPTREDNHEQWAAPIRSLRERKPIQVNPYLLEKQHYRQTLKSRGVRPLRIEEVEGEVERSHARDDDSQEAEYVAPPEPDYQPRRIISWAEEEIQSGSEAGVENELPTSSKSLRERPGPNTSMPKRRKVSHTYSKRHSTGNIDKTPRNSTQRKENIRPPPAAQTAGIAREPDIYSLSLTPPPLAQKTGVARERDIYSQPTITPPPRIRTLSVKTNLNQAIRPSVEENTNLIGGPSEERRGLLSVLDLSSESDPEPSGPSRRTRLVSQVSERERPSPITIHSSPPPSLSAEEDEDGDEYEDEYEEDESQIITKFQRKTNGVLPASWWKLDRNKQVSGTNDNRRGKSPSRNDTLRPGVAKAKISTRVREPEDVFLLGDDSDSSSDSPVIVSFTKRRISGRDAQERWLDIDDTIGTDTIGTDIIEDDRIDLMLPTISRRRKKTPTKRKQVEGNQSSERALIASSSRNHNSTSRQGSGSTRLRQPKITGHASSKKKTASQKRPTVPRVGIVDAVQHHRATTTVSPPTFIKLAARSARERRDQGRQSPSRKLFVLETAMDTRDVQDVLKNWREGTLSFTPEHDPSEGFQETRLSHDGAQEYRPSKHQLKLPSPQNLSEPQSHSSKRQSKPSSSIAKPSQPRKQGGRQTKLSNIIRKEPISKKPTSVHPQPKTQAGIVTAMPGPSSSANPRPNFALQPAQPEVEAPFNNTLRRLHQVARRARTPNITELVHYTAQKNQHLARFMEDEDLVQPMPLPSLAARNISAATPGQQPGAPRSHKPAPRARRKGTPKRIDADTIERRQPPSQDLVIDDPDPLISGELPKDKKPVLQGLLPYDKKYPLNFDTAPFKPGTIFNSETFIGNEGLSKALNTLPAGCSKRNHGNRFTFGDKILEWGVYDDFVAADFEAIMNQIADATEKACEKDELNDVKFYRLILQVYSFYMFFSNYLAQVISFDDPIDIISFGQRVLQAINVCCDRVVEILGGTDTQFNPGNPLTRLKLQLLAFSLVFSFQVYKISSADAQIQVKLEVGKEIQKSGHQLVGQLMKCGLVAVRGCYEDQRQRNKYERGIDQEHYIVELWVIAIQILGQTRSPDTHFWQLFNSGLHTVDLERALDVRLFENHWRIVFTILPLFQFNISGVIQQPLKQCHSSENWALLKTPISRPLRVYNTNPEGHSGKAIDYCRVLYARCHHLISSWGWTNPDIIIPTLYEFFASNSLANLKNENEYGSAEFLQCLEKDPSLAVRDSDRCFHILLKTVAIGINLMKTTSTTRKIGNIVNRLMPNHRRQYPKEEGLRIEHLTALKNHHDLLATLYWAAPPNCRPHIDAIRNLVDPELSHRRACSVSIRTWSNLLRFQLHSGEDIKTLEPFMEWFDDLVTHTLNQHHAARSEAEKQFKVAKDRGDTGLSEGVLESNIRRNQIELEGILNDAVKSLTAALSGIGGQVENAIIVFTKASTANILNSHNRLSNKLVVGVLQLIQQYISVCKTQDSPPQAIVQPSDEDSQDYGDWSGIEDLVIQDQRRPAAEHLLTVVYDSLHRMLSNCFGADNQPGESLLVKVVDTWTSVIGFLVQNGLKTWGNYLDSYSSESWAALRDTEQTRKFTAYFMPKIIQSGGGVYEANKTVFISFWLKTLVERESMLRFQSEYTATLLKFDPENHTLVNLPFVRDESTGDYNITQTDFRLRRLSLISTVLANMRESHEAAHHDSLQKAASIKLEYSEMLSAMMKSMKENYQELQAGSSSGAYIEFVQQVVEYLQQYSTDLVSIDRFFTDSTAFPLPATDPTYVVGRLKNYGLKLHHPRTHKALFSFFQSLCERAAVDGQQEYLVSQLTTALSGEFEDGNSTRPTMRALFLEAIFPVYVECAFREPCGWILAIPILKASGQLISAIQEDIDSTHHGCVKSVLSMFTSLLEGMRLAVNFLTVNPSKAISPPALGTLTFMVIAVTKMIPIVDWLSASGNLIDKLAEVAYDCTCYLIKYAGYIRALIENREGEPPIDLRMNQTSQGPYESLRKDCEAILKTAITKEWTNYRGSWYIIRGASRKEVHPPPLGDEQGGFEKLKKSFNMAVETLLAVACRTDMFEPVGNSVDIGIWEFEARGKPYRGGVRGRKQHVRALLALEGLFC